jgi:NADH:ubiquinone oxidoreductase subunit 3 (subunit A)
MFCRNCGNELPAGAKFCTQCGTKVIQARQPEPAPEPVFVPEPEPAPEFVPEPEPAPVFVPEPEPEPEPAPEPVFVQPGLKQPYVQPEPAPETYDRTVRAFNPEPEPQSVPEPNPQPVFIPQPTPAPAPKRQTRSEQREAAYVKPERTGFEPEKETELPAEYRPLSPWAYFGYALLFAIPVIGLILLIVFSFAGKNVNRKNFARSYWCMIILVMVLVLSLLILVLTGVLKGPIEAAIEWLRTDGLAWLSKAIG